MNTASKLALLCALALAAMAVASASALAQATVTPTGAWTATEDGPGNLDNGVLNITCTESTAAGTVQNTTGTTTGGTTTTTPPRATITTLTFTSCELITGTPCTVTVDTLPASLNIKHVTTGANTAGSDPSGTTGATQTAVATLVDTESATITCGATNCTATADTTLHLQGFNTIGAAPATLRTVDQEVIVSGTTGCGTPIEPGAWNSQWTVNTSAGGTDTTLAVEA